jgi:hypothetical protein
MSLTGQLPPGYASTGQPHRQPYAAAVVKVAGRGLPSVELGDEPYDVKPQPQVRLAVAAWP